MLNRKLGAAIIAFLAIGLTIASGVLHGRIRHAIGLGVNLEHEAELLNSLPKEIGRWSRVDDSEGMDEYVVRLLECDGYHSAMYENTDNGDRVYATLLLGPSGPTAVHDPESCMPSQNYRPFGKRERVKIRTESAFSAETWQSIFESGDLDKHVALVAYAWTTDGNWQAPEDPRWEFAGKPYLYKLQVSTVGPHGDEQELKEPVRDFLEAFVETVNSHVFTEAK